MHKGRCDEYHGLGGLNNSLILKFKMETPAGGFSWGFSLWLADGRCPAGSWHGPSSVRVLFLSAGHRSDEEPRQCPHFNQSPFHRPYVQTQPYSEVLSVGTSTHEFGERDTVCPRLGALEVWAVLGTTWTLGWFSSSGKTKRRSPLSSTDPHSGT